MFLVTNPEHSLIQAAMETTNFIPATACIKIENLDLGTNTHKKWDPQQPSKHQLLASEKSMGWKGLKRALISNPPTAGRYTFTTPENWRIV